MVPFSPTHRPCASAEDFLSQISNKELHTHAVNTFEFFQKRVGTTLELCLKTRDGKKKIFKHKFAGVSFARYIQLFFFVDDTMDSKFTTCSNLRKWIGFKNSGILRETSVKRNWMIGKYRTEKMLKGVLGLNKSASGECALHWPENPDHEQACEKVRNAQTVTTNWKAKIDALDEPEGSTKKRKSLKRKSTSGSENHQNASSPPRKKKSSTQNSFLNNSAHPSHHKKLEKKEPAIHPAEELEDDDDSMHPAITEFSNAYFEQASALGPQIVQKFHEIAMQEMLERVRPLLHEIEALKALRKREKALYKAKKLAYKRGM